jgi:hexosaminidase
MKNSPKHPVSSLAWKRRAATPLAALCMLFLPAMMAAQQPQLIPQPREVQTQSGSFLVAPPSASGPSAEIRIGLPVNSADAFAAGQLNRELKQAAGFVLPVASPPPGAEDHVPAITLGRFDQPAIAKLLQARGIQTGDIGDEGYVLDVAPGSVLVAGKDEAGLFYGVQTLRQLVIPDGKGASITGVRVRDWPALRYRGTQVDLARGPVPKLEYMKRIVRTIAQYKMNQLYLYMEDSFRLKGQPLVGVLSDTLSQRDWRELVAYAAPYHVDLIPATEGCGHLHKVLRFEQYSGIAERPHGHVLAPGDPKAAAFLNSMYQQMAPVFPAPFYHIGCDETEELGLGRSAPLVQQSGYAQVYVSSLKQAYELALAYHKEVMFWGDIAAEHPEMIGSLPKDAIVASWEYGPHPNYDKWVQPFAAAGMKVLICPWVANTSLIIPDNEEAVANISRFIRDGHKANAIGTDVTVWNDDGESLYGLNWWGIVYGAASAWEPGMVDMASFNQKYDWDFYRNPGHQFADAISSLSHLNEVLRAGHETETYDEHMGGADDIRYWINPFTTEGQAVAARVLPVAAIVRTQAEAAFTTFDNNRSQARRNADTLDDLEFAALKMDALGMRYQFAQEISNLYARAVIHQKDSQHPIAGNELAEIESTNGRLDDMRDYTTRLRELYKQLWLRENLPGWLPNILQRYDSDSQMLLGLGRQFRSLRYLHYSGKPLPPADSLGLLPPTDAQ